jgi:hypothetical protein
MAALGMAGAGSSSHPAAKRLRFSRTLMLTSNSSGTATKPAAASLAAAPPAVPAVAASLSPAATSAVQAGEHNAMPAAAAKLNVTDWRAANTCAQT